MIVGSITDVKSQVNLRDDVSGTYRFASPGFAGMGPPAGAVLKW
jgi:hypothetical protein